MENIEGMVTVGRSRGIRYLFVLQSFSQLNAKYGRDIGDIIKTNCNIKIFIGSDDPDTRNVEDLFEQYRPYMIWVFLATAAIWSIVMGVFFAIAHKNEDKEKARRMLVNYFIGLVVIFAILVACPYLIRGIAALVT